MPKGNLQYRIDYGFTREDRAYYLLVNNDIIPQSFIHDKEIVYYDVASQTNAPGTLSHYNVAWHSVTGEATCECADHLLRGTDECKHILAVKQFRKIKKKMK